MMFCSAFAGSLPYDVAAVLMLSLSWGKVLMLILGLVQDGYLISSKHCITIMSSCMLHFALHEWIPASWNPFVAPHTKKTKVLQIRQHNMSTYVTLLLGEQNEFRSCGLGGQRSRSRFRGLAAS